MVSVTWEPSGRPELRPLPPARPRLPAHSPLKPQVEAGMALEFHTPPQFWPQKLLQQTAGQGDKHHTGKDKQCQGPLEIQEAGNEQEDNKCWGMEQRKDQPSLQACSLMHWLHLTPSKAQRAGNSPKLSECLFPYLEMRTFIPNMSDFVTN